MGDILLPSRPPLVRGDLQYASYKSTRLGWALYAILTSLVHVTCVPIVYNEYLRIDFDKTSIEHEYVLLPSFRGCLLCEAVASRGLGDIDWLQNQTQKKMANVHSSSHVMHYPNTYPALNKRGAVCLFTRYYVWIFNVVIWAQLWPRWLIRSQIRANQFFKNITYCPIFGCDINNFCTMIFSIKYRPWEFQFFFPAIWLTVPIWRFDGLA